MADDSVGESGAATVTLLTRRTLLPGSLALASLCLLCGCAVLPPTAQQQTRVTRIGLLAPGSSDAYASRVKAIL